MTGPLPACLQPLAVPASWLYAAAIGWRNRRFDRGRGVTRVRVPVISVGNLTAGGTGKTPVVQWAVGRLIAGGCRPAIAMRGYGAAGDRQASDEAREHAETWPDATVLADPDRVAAIGAALNAGRPIDAVVLDDGFQHRRLARDLDIVLIDARAGPLTDRVLPAGWLREPVDGLARADAVVITHARVPDADSGSDSDAGADSDPELGPGLHPDIAAAVTAITGRPPVAWTRHVWGGLRLRPGGEPLVGPGSAVAAGWLEGRAIGVMAGIGRPAGVVDMATAAGARVVHVEPLRDHHRHDAPGWAAADARARAAGAEAILVTRKDRVKLAGLTPPAGGLPIVEPVLELEFLAGESALAAMIDAAAGIGPAADPIIPRDPRANPRAAPRPPVPPNPTRRDAPDT